MACVDQITQQNLIDAKTDATTLGEVATSRAGAVSAGAPITSSTNRFGNTTDTLQGRLDKLGVIISDPIDDWTALTSITDMRAHRYPATTGDVYIPVKPLPFTTDATFNIANWVLYSGEVLQDRTITKATIAAMTADDDLVAGQFIGVEDYAAGRNSGVLFFKVTAGAAPAPDGGSQIDHDTLAIHFVQDFGAIILVEAFGASATGDVTTNLQAAFDFVSNNSHYQLSSLDIDYTTSATLTISANAVNIKMHPNSDIVSSVTGGDFAVEILGGIFQDIDIYVKNTVADGNAILIKNKGTAGVDNSLYNKIGGRCQNLVGKAGTKPARDVGSVGVSFGSVVSGDSNYFNHLKSGFRVRGYDTAIKTEADANAQQILSPQIENYWYGFDIDSDENNISAGFAHFAPGIDASNLTEAIVLRTARTFNDIRGMVIEPGAFASAGTIDAGAKGNKIDVFDNSGNGFVNLGSDNGALDGAGNTNYRYATLLENTYYQLSKITFASNNRRAKVRVTFDSFNATTTSSSAGTAEFIVARDSGGTVTVEPIHDSLQRTGAGTLELRGYEVSGSDVYLVFFVVNNATATTTCVGNIKVEGSMSLGIVERHSATTAAPSVTTNAERGVDSFAVLAVGGNRWSTGVGSPEGVLAGDLGDLYSNTNGGAGVTLYVKEAGAAGSNTGWAGV